MEDAAEGERDPHQVQPQRREAAELEQQQQDQDQRHILDEVPVHADRLFQRGMTAGAEPGFRLAALAHDQRC